MPQAIISLVLFDSDADTSTVSVFVSVGTGDTVLSLSEDYAHVFWDVVRPITRGILQDVKVSILVDYSEWDNNIVDYTSDVEEKAVFNLRVCGGLRPTKLSIPAINETIFENAGRGKFVDMTNVDVVAFAAVMENGVVDGGIGATDSHGSDICQVMFGEQFFGKG